MRSRHTITAALALGVVTILAVAACGSSVQGTAQVNSAAAATMTTEERTPESLPTDLSDLSSMLDDLTTELSVPTDLSLPTDLTFPTDFPTDLGDLTDLNVPGYNNACISVSLAYLSVTLAPLATLAGGSSAYDASEFKQALKDLRDSGQIPEELLADINALDQLAEQAGSGTLSDASNLFSSPEFVTASDNISAWLDANCGGS
jgi:hypothetical protein